jgi:hypothetical protein
MNSRTLALTVVFGTFALSSLMGCASQLPTPADQPGAHALVGFAAESSSRREPSADRLSRADRPAERNSSSTSRRSGH